MAVKAINDWLNGSRNYSDGVALYSIHGKSNVLKRLFVRSENAYNVAKLAEELEGINLTTSVPVVVSKPNPSGKKRDIFNIKSFQPKQEHTIAPVDLTTAPLELKRLDQERRLKFQQAAELKSALDNGQFRTKAERLKALIIIHENFYGNRGIQEIWRRIDYWRKHGQFVPFSDKEVLEPIDRNKVHKRLMTVRTYETRYRNNPEKKHLFEKYRAERIELEQQLMENGK